MRKIFTYSFSILSLILANLSPVSAQTYCVPTYNQPCNSLDYIDNFSINTLVNNGSGCNGNADNFVYYNASPTTTLLKGNTYTITVQAGSTYSQGFGVWIDYNNDGDFDDLDEFLYSSPGWSTNAFTGVVIIPQSVSVGSKRLRVRCQYANTINRNESCSNFYYGETEDYQVTIGTGNSNIGYNLNPSAICAGHVATFVNTTTDPGAYQYEWNLGDGTTFTNTNPTSFTHNYTNPGIYNTSVKVYNNSGIYLGGDAKERQVQQGTNGSFWMSKDSSCVNEMVSFDPNGNSGFIKWHMSDGYTSTNWYTSRTFTALGTYTVHCICNTPCGVDTISRIFKVVNTVVPNSNFSFNPGPSACPNTYVNFYPVDYSGTHLWNFGDGTTSSTPSPYHTYTALATYSVTHTVTNSCGNQSSQTYTISIDNTTYPTNANFGYSPSGSICPGIQVSFNSNNWEGDWAWDFGDGGTAIGQNPKHTYSSPGTYTVTHTITNECNNTVSTQQVITIDGTLVPNAGFSLSSSQVCPNDLMYFNPYEYYGKTYSWNFGDGHTSSLKNPVHQYTTTGTYSISLTITNFCNLSASYTNTVNVSGTLPVALSGNMSMWPSSACPTQPVNLSAGNWGFAQYDWNFGDGQTSTTNNGWVVHSYSVAGAYTASVTISNNCGSDSTIALAVNISNAVAFPVTALSVGPNPVCPNQSIGLNAPWGYPSYEWDLGDGSPALVTTTPYVSYTYSATGSYPVSVKITDYCNRDSTYRDTIDVINSANFCLSGTCNVNTWASGPSCPNQSVNFQTDNGYAWYEWQFGDGTTTGTSNNQTSHTYTAAGTYNYTLTITNFCGADTTVYNYVNIDNSIQVPGWVNIYPSPDVACPGQTIDFNTDNSYNSYYWSFGDGYSAYGTANVSHTYTAAAIYNVSVTITNSCGNNATVVNQVIVDPGASFPSWMSLNNFPANSCPGAAMTLETTPGYDSYNWDFGDGNTLVSSTSKVMHVYANAGSYNAAVEITNSCGNTITLYRSITVDANVLISNVDLFIPNNPACVGDAVMMGASAGGPGIPEPGITYAWDFGDGSPLDTTVGVGITHSYTATGVYNVSVTAINACGNSKSTSRFVTINNSATPFLYPWTFGVLTEDGQTVGAVCPGDVLVFYFQGVYPNNLWTFGDGYTATATDLFVQSNGMTITTVKHAYVNTGSFTYSLELENNCGNTSTLSKSINVNGNMLNSGGFSIEPPTSSIGYTTCGLIDFVAFGGNNFDWDFGDGDTLSTVSPTVGHSYSNPGNYTIRVTITNGCGNSATYIKTLVINGQGGTSVNAAPVSPSCYGGSNGSASASVTGGQAPYSYAWYNSLNQLISTGLTASGLSAGSYAVEVTDASGCMGASSIVLTNPAAITFSVSSTPSGCGNATGTATASNISGGTGPYTYVWSNGKTTSTVTGLAMGNYAVTVTSANGCTSMQTASVSENGAVLSVNSITNASCSNSTNGAVSINATSGTAPYTFAWSTGATTQNLNGVAPGNYTVIVTDNGGCLSTLNATVGSPAALNVNATALASPTCGNFDGKAIANVSGGTTPYSYLWPNAGNKTTQSVTGLVAGNYTVNVTDANGCTNNGVIALSNANAPVITSVVTPVSCNNMSDGAINLTVTGGTSPYGFSWSTGSINEDESGLPYGPYFVQIQDAAGCNSFRTFNLVNPAVLTATLSTTSSTCNNNGIASAAVSGGTAPYTYTWQGGGTTQSISNLAAGTYTVGIKDSHNCSVNATATVTANPIALTPSETDVTCFGLNNGTASVSVGGGTSPYTYAWSNSATTQGISNVAGATYSVLVTDTRGCTKTQTVVVGEPAVLTAPVTKSNVTCFGLCNGTATVTPAGGNSPYQYSWSTSPAQTTQVATGLCPNAYNVTVTDNKGCVTTPNVSITEPAVLSVTVTASPATCGSNNGSVTAAVSGGNTPYTYAWTGGQTTQAATGLALGSYTGTITDSQGCVAAGSATVTLFTAPVSICAISVDPTSTKNLIAWVKPGASNIDSFRIYREISSVYTKIGAVAYEDSSYFVDNTNGVNPNITSYKYKISVLDNCGNESAQSGMHQTMHLQVGVAAPPNSFNLSWNDYIGFPITQYRIMVDSLNNGNWKARDSVSFGINSWTDIYYYPDTVNYMIEIAHPTGCAISIKDPNPMASNLNLSKSNINRISGTPTGLQDNSGVFSVSVSPNPNHGIFSIITDKTDIARVQVLDMLGNEVLSINNPSLNKGVFNIQMPQAKGVYILKVNSRSGVVNKMLVIE